MQTTFGTAPRTAGRAITVGGRAGAETGFCRSRAQPFTLASSSAAEMRVAPDRRPQRPASGRYSPPLRPAARPWSRLAPRWVSALATMTTGFGCASASAAAPSCRPSPAFRGPAARHLRALQRRSAVHAASACAPSPTRATMWTCGIGFQQPRMRRAHGGTVVAQHHPQLGGRVMMLMRPTIRPGPACRQRISSSKGFMMYSCAPASSAIHDALGAAFRRAHHDHGIIRPELRPQRRRKPMPSITGMLRSSRTAAASLAAAGIERLLRRPPPRAR
jgi:hypothetical protein